MFHLATVFEMKVAVVLSIDEVELNLIDVRMIFSEQKQLSVLFVKLSLYVCLSICLSDCVYRMSACLSVYRDNFQ